MSYLLDTNILTAIIKNNPQVNYKFKEVNDEGEKIFISCITYFESEAGLLAINSQKKLRIIESLCKNDLEVLLLDKMEIIHIASRIYADLKIKVTPIQTADILIAATAIYHNLILVSNDSDMLRVSGLIVENWLE
jgi:tRNA(fMet)-specific endonuclease VapC